MVLALEAELEVLPETCVGSAADEISSAGAVEVSCAELATGENPKKAIKAAAASERGKTKERTIDEQFPLNRADGTGGTASGISVNKMTRPSKRFALRAHASFYL